MKLTKAHGQQAFQNLLQKIGQNPDDYKLWLLCAALPSALSQFHEKLAKYSLDLVFAKTWYVTELLEFFESTLAELAPNLSPVQAKVAFQIAYKLLLETSNGEIKTNLQSALQIMPLDLNEDEATKAFSNYFKDDGSLTDKVYDEDYNTLASIAKYLTNTQSRGAATSELISVVDSKSDNERDMLVASQFAKWAATVAISNRSIENVDDSMHALVMLLLEYKDDQVVTPVWNTIQAIVARTEDNDPLSQLVTACPRLVYLGGGCRLFGSLTRAIVRTKATLPAASKLAAAIAYPASAGSATETLLDKIHELHLGAVASNAGTHESPSMVSPNLP